MRNYIFRAKDRVTKGWVYGSLHNWKDDYFIMSQNNDTNAHTNYLVLPETIGQGIDQTDKNRVSMYEGDLLLVNTSNISEEDGYGVVEYDEETARYVVSFEGFVTDFDHLYGYNCEVVGNIHDNKQEENKE